MSNSQEIKSEITPGTFHLIDTNLGEGGGRSSKQGWRLWGHPLNPHTSFGASTSFYVFPMRCAPPSKTVLRVQEKHH